MDLVELVEKGKLGDLQSLLSAGAPVDSRDSEGLTLLMIAALNNKHNIVSYLLEKGAQVNAVCGNQWTPLMHSAVGGDVKVAQTLIEAGADVNAKTDDGNTAILEAAYSGNDEVLKLLIEKGADINCRAKNRGTPLTEACWQGNPSSINILLEHGADIHARCRYGDTVLSWAASHAHLDIVRKLLAAGAEVNDAAEYGGTPLMSAVRANSKDVVMALLDAGAEIEKKDHSGNDVFSCVGGASVELVELLLDRCSNPAAYASTVCLQAVTFKNFDVIKLLLEREYKLPPEAIIHAAQVDGALVELLLTNKADPNYEDDRNYTALRVAASNGDCKTARMLIDAGADINAVDKNGNMAIHLAAAAGYLDMVMLLICCGSDAYEKNSVGTSLLMLACASGNAELVSLLLDRYSFDLNEVDESNKTALAWSIYTRPNIEVLEMLLKRGASLSIPEGFNPLVCPCTSGLYEDRYVQPKDAKSDPYYEIVDLLLRSGADPNFVLKDWPLAGSNLLDLARETRCPEVVHLLIKYGAREKS